jgi:hypothetical protein
MVKELLKDERSYAFFTKHGKTTGTLLEELFGKNWLKELKKD